MAESGAGLAVAELALLAQGYAKENARLKEELAAETQQVTDAREQAHSAVEAHNELVEQIRGLLGLVHHAYGISVACKECGAPQWKPCISEGGKFTLHQRRVTKATAEISTDDLFASLDLLKSNQQSQTNAPSLDHDRAARARESLICCPQDGACGGCVLNAIRLLTFGQSMERWPVQPCARRTASDNRKPEPAP